MIRMARSRMRMWALLFALLISACRGDLISEPDELSLEGTMWVLDSIDLSGKITEPGRGEVYSMLLEESRISGRADCNDCTGTYHFRTDDAIVVSLGCTEMACGPEESTLPHFPIYASGVFDIAFDASTLTLQKHQSEGSLTLIFGVGDAAGE